MGTLSSAPGVAIVVPGYFVCAGILLYTAIIAAVVGTYRGRVPLYLAFAATCLSSAGIAVCMASYYLADSVGGATEAMRWQNASASVFLGSLFAFVALYSGAPRMRPWFIAATALVAVFVAASFLLPYGIRFSAVSGSGWMHMPWGESLFHLEGVPSAWNLGFRALSVTVVAWAVWRLVLHYRKGNPREAKFLAAYLLVLLGASAQGALIDMGIIRSFHAIGFALAGLALLMCINLLMRFQQYNVELKATADELRVENERRRIAETEIRERAFRDELTGLPNRMFVQEHLALTLAITDAPAYGAVLQCNLDHFKVVNDALSHHVGDELLQEVARRISQTVGGRGIVARVGGDEFMVVLDRMTAAEEEAAQRIRVLAEDLAQAMAAPFTCGEQALHLFASIGTATFGADVTEDETFRRVGMALHHAKRRGGNAIQVFQPAFQRRAEEKYRIVEGLRRAIADNELTLNYQPQIDADGKVFGAEALMRWRSAEMGQVLPSAFIPIAEETGLIHALGEWALRRGCETLAAWRRDEAPFEGHLSINVSPWQLARPDFVPRLVSIMRECRANPGQITLEITESALLYDVGETVAKLREIRPIGVRIALDDFGTGYSSLALIKDLPLDAIKIDQSFVRRLHEGTNQHLVRVVVAIGHELGLEVIAEGVETQAQRETLLALGCRNMQGFLWSQPLPDAEFVRWLAARAPGPGSEPGRPLNTMIELQK